MSTPAGPQSALSLTDKHKYRQQLSAEVDGLRRQVEELRQHVKQGNQITPEQQHFMAQLQGGNSGLNPQQQQQRANILNSFTPLGNGQDMRQGMAQGGPNDEAIFNERMVQRRQAELSEIMDQQRKLYSNLDNLDRQRSQIIGDMDKTAALNFHLQQGPNGRFPSQLQDGLSQNPPSQFSSPMNQMRPSGNIGTARDVLNGFPSTMQFLQNRNKGSSDIPASLMSNDFGGISSGYHLPKTAAGGAVLGALRGRYEAKLQEMDGANDPTHMDKRRRFLSNGLPEKQLGRMPTKNFHDQRISSSYLPSEIMVTPNNNADSLSVLSSSRQLLMSQREANMQRDMIFFQGMNNGQNSIIPGLNRVKPQHDRKLPETKRKLTKDFVPEVDTVVLGKGNIPKTNIGNLKLKEIVRDNLVEYANGERRKKIAVISRIINHVTSNNYKTTGFIKFEGECWYEMTERDARVKITALFRDCLSDQYRSSSSSKVKRRQEMRKSRSLASSVASEKAAKGEKETPSSSKPQDESKDNGAKPTKDDETSEKETLKRKNESEENKISIPSAR